MIMSEKKAEERKVPENIMEQNIWQKMSYMQGLNIDVVKDKQAHGYAYATLDQIMDKIRPILFEVGLLVYHTNGYDSVEKKSRITTIIRDVNKPDQTLQSETLLDDTIVLPGQNKVMVVGSMITYYRRYHVTSLFGLTTETDTDAGGASNSKSAKAPAGRSVEAAGTSEKTIDFVAIFKNQIAKGKDKATVEKLLENYKPKMSEAQLKEVTELITNIK